MTSPKASAPGVQVARPSEPEAPERRDEPPGTRARRSLPQLGRIEQGILAFGVFLALSVALFGFRVLPHPFTHYIGWKGADPKIFMWSLAWWPHAIGDGINPFFSHAVWPPVGVNLAWVTAIPGPSLLLTPLTLTLGPIATYNLLVVLSPALSAWAAYLLARRIGASFAGALVAGYLYGFTAYQIGHALVAHPNLILVPWPPLAAYLLLRRVDASLGPRAFVALLAFVLVMQFTTSTELFLSMTLFGGLALVVAFLLRRGEERRPLLGAVKLTGLAYAITALVVSPYLWYALTNIPPKSIQSPEHFALDLLAFVVPTKTAAIGWGAFDPVSRHFVGNYDVQNGYVGFALLAALLLFAAGWWRTLVGKVLTVAFVVFAVLSFGPVLHIAGARTVALPWRGLWSIPVVENMLPGRFMMYAYLVLGLAMALWLTTRDRLRPARWVLVLIGIVLLFPNRSFITWDTPTDIPAFIETGMYRDYLREGEPVAIVPYTDNVALLWQTKTNFYFPILEGWLGQIPEPFRHSPIVRKLLRAKIKKRDTPELRAFFSSHGVRKVIVDGDLWWSYWRPRLLELDPTPTEVGGVVLLDVSSGP